MMLVLVCTMAIAVSAAGTDVTVTAENLNVHLTQRGDGVYTKVYDGSTYRGFWEGGVRHGYGELTYRQESDYYGKKNKKGQWKNDVFIKPM